MNKETELIITAIVTFVSGGWIFYWLGRAHQMHINNRDELNQKL